MACAVDNGVSPCTENESCVTDLHTAVFWFLKWCVYRRELPDSVHPLMKNLCFKKMAQRSSREKALPLNIDAQVHLENKSWRRCLTVAVSFAYHNAISY